jgi:hypothetical protein
VSSTLNCSFCRKSENQVQKLVAGPGVYICDECVGIASRIMEVAGPNPPKLPLWRRLLTSVQGVFDAVRNRYLGCWGTTAGVVPRS